MRESLATIQARFLALVSQPRRVGDAARERASSDAGASPLVRWIAARDEESATARLDVYAQMYFARLRDSLREDYPALETILGASDFERVIADYLVAHASEEPSLHGLGRGVPTFVEEHALARRRPDAADLARLEWSRLTTFAAADAEPLDAAAFAGIAQERMGEIVLRAIPALRLVPVAYAVDDVWLEADRGRAAPVSARRASTLVVWRQGFTVKHRAVDAREARALAVLVEGASLDGICEACASDDDSIETAAARAFEALRQWIADGIVIVGR